MKTPFGYRTASCLASFTLVLLLGGQAFACLFPSLTEMRDGRSMACCTQSCRFEPTPAEAQKACEQSQLAVNQHPVIVSPAAMALPITPNDLPSVSLGPPHEPLVQRLTVAAQAAPENDLSFQYGTKRYLLTRALLI